MKNDKPLPQVFIFTALDCEAKPLINFFELKKDKTQYPFQVYSNDLIVLSVSGVGKVAMAGAVAYIMALFSNSIMPVLLNVGIAGHAIGPIGSLYAATKIVDVETGKRFYPQLINADWLITSEIKTMAAPCLEYKENCLYDMEASAFYEMGVRFTNSELTHSLKIVSDTKESSIENIKPKLVSDWITGQINEIERLINHLYSLQQSVKPVKLDGYEIIIERWHFTVSGQIKLKALLRRWAVLSSDCWLEATELNFNNSKALLHKLESDINKLDLYL